MRKFACFIAISFTQGTDDALPGALRVLLVYVLGIFAIELAIPG
jgi:hypothetical protein